MGLFQLQSEAVSKLSNTCESIEQHIYGSQLFLQFHSSHEVAQINVDSIIFAEESVSVDPIKNAMKLLQKWGVLECHSEKKLRLYYLVDSENNSEAVKDVYRQLDKFRKS